MFKKILAFLLTFIFLGIAGGAIGILILLTQLPDLVSVKNYNPLLVSEVFDRKSRKIGEFFREKRYLVPIDEIPQDLIRAFISSEDASFFKHKGINFISILRAFVANIKARKKVQGGSTITMQVARSLLLTREKTYIRKLKEVILAYRIEKNLTKREILYLYLNQIYLGSGAYGVKTAAQIYFRKSLKELDMAEILLLAGLPQAPSRYSPIYNPREAKIRQLYVLNRMVEEKYVTAEQAQQISQIPIKVYVRQNYEKLAPFYLEVVRQILVKKIGEEMVLDKGVRVFTGLDLDKQLAANAAIEKGLRNLDKRQGFRGSRKHLKTNREIKEFLIRTRDELIEKANPVRFLQANGSLTMKNMSLLEELKLKKLNEEVKDKKKKKDDSSVTGSIAIKWPSYLKMNDIVQGVVTKVDDQWGLVFVKFAEVQGLIDIESMKWARVPDPYVKSEDDEIEKPSEALKIGDVILVKVVKSKFSSSRISKILIDRKQRKKKKKQKDPEWPEDLPQFEDYILLELEQEPVAEAALISFDQKSEEIISMVGGYDFERSKFNRSLQAIRQTGSAFKPILYTSALDRGYTPATSILDSAIVYDESKDDKGKENDKKEENLRLKDSSESKEKWKPKNYSNRFMGEVLFRNALIRSLNVPTVKIIQDIGVSWVKNYARRLGVYSPLNNDLTLGLGSSGVTLYEMTKVLSQIGRLGKRVRPLLIHKVENQKGEVILENVSLDERFINEIEKLQSLLEEKRKRFFELLSLKRNLEILKSSQSMNEATQQENEAKISQNRAQLDLDEEQESKNLENREVFFYSKSKQTSIALNASDVSNGKTKWTEKELETALSQFPPFFFDDPDQLIDKKTAYIITSLLQGVVEDRRGTGQLARYLNRPVAGKTGTTDGNYDAWFMGYTNQYVSGVWVGFDEEKTLGKGEVGGNVALRIWFDHMKHVHEGLPVQEFSAPKGIVFVNIDNETGKLASSSSKEVVSQAFIEGTEPQISEIDDHHQVLEEEKSFLREDYSN